MIPGVNNVAASSDVPGKQIVENYQISRINSKDNEHFAASIPSIDTSFLSTYGIRLISGRTFNEGEKMVFRINGAMESIPVMVNEAFVKRMGMKNPEDALNEKLEFGWGPEGRRAEIIGVTTDHHQVSFKEMVEPVMYIQPQWMGWKYFSVSVKPGNMQKTIASVESLYTKAFPGTPFTYFFLDEFYDRQYHADQQFGNIFNVFTVLAIIVTCLGLLGLAIFSVTRRTKEVGIRKALGASAGIIMFLFTKDFVRILFIAYVLSVPIVYYAGNQWLENFSFRIALGWKIYLLPPLLLLFITMLTIGIISLKSALENPVKALRHE
ncbi:MAG: FtsX-like permease family protein [Chryseolinea sp.]